MFKKLGSFARTSKADEDGHRLSTVSPATGTALAGSSSSSSSIPTSSSSAERKLTLKFSQRNLSDTKSSTKVSAKSVTKVCT